MKRFIFCIFVLFLTVQANAQHRVDFDLKKEKNHFYFSANIAGENVDVMLESGIPAFLIGKSFFERHLGEIGFDFNVSQTKIRLLNSLYAVIYQKNGRIDFDSVYYEGPIFILDNFNGLSLPIQYFHNASDGSSIVEVNIPENRFSVLPSQELKGAKTFHLSYDAEMGFPLISAEITIETSAGVVELSEDLIVDFGNPMPLFLMKQNKSLETLVQDGKITLHDAFDPVGNVIGKGIYAEKLVICGQIFEKCSIGITDKMSNIKQFGFLGIPFFNSSVIFDFSNGLMIM